MTELLFNKGSFTGIKLYPIERAKDHQIKESSNIKVLFETIFVFEKTKQFFVSCKCTDLLLNVPTEIQLAELRETLSKLFKSQTDVGKYDPTVFICLMKMNVMQSKLGFVVVRVMQNSVLNFHIESKERLHKIIFQRI